MSFQSHRNVSISAGDAAVLIHAMNRQRGRADAAVATPPVEVVRAPRPKASPHAKGGPTHGNRPRSRRTDLRAVEGGRARERRRDVRPGREARRPQRTMARANRDEARSKRSSRRGDAGRNASTGAIGSAAAWFAGLSSHGRTALLAVIGVVAFVAFFYGPTADLYAAHRDHAQLVAKVEATQAIADDLEAQVHRLQTEEGIMDEARIRGYAAPGEEAADASELLGIEESVTVPELSKPIETEEPSLGTRVLDVLMGYEERTT